MPADLTLIAISQKWNFKLYLLLQFLSNQPETFMICSSDFSKTLIATVF